MSTIDKISALLKENQKTQKDLMDYLGLEKSTFTAWKANKNTSYKQYIYEIAEFFGVSTDYLLGRTDDPINYDDNTLIAEIPEDILEHFNGNVKEAYRAWKARTELDKTETRPKLRSLARLENDEFTEDEDRQIFDFIEFIKRKRGE